MNNIVNVDRLIYSPSEFAKNSLLYLQETGISTSLKFHISSRKFKSYLFFIVLDGNGLINYNNKDYAINKGDIVFIDCMNKYSHSSNNWTIRWVHFYGNVLPNIYDKYIERGGKPFYSSKYFETYNSLLNDIASIAKDDSYTRDMTIYNLLTSLLNQLMNETVYTNKSSNNKYDIKDIKFYLDANYCKDITLDQLSSIFFINKYYLTRLFKDTYSFSIINYINNKRINKAKELLRYSELSLTDISLSCGIKDFNYFSRLFKKIENHTPIEYRKLWK